MFRFTALFLGVALMAPTLEFQAPATAPDLAPIEVNSHQTRCQQRPTAPGCPRANREGIEAPEQAETPGTNAQDPATEAGAETPGTTEPGTAPPPEEGAQLPELVPATEDPTRQDTCEDDRC